MIDINDLSKPPEIIILANFINFQASVVRLNLEQIYSGRSQLVKLGKSSDLCPKYKAKYKAFRAILLKP